MKLAPLAIGLLVVGSSHAICLNPFGCGPSTFQECRSEAAKMPTEAGVRLAVSDCTKKFITDPEETRRKSDEMRVSEQWKRIAELTDGTSFKNARDKMGEPTSVGKVIPCKNDDGSLAGGNCQWYEWRSFKQKTLCPNIPGVIRFYDLEGEYMYRASFNLNNWTLFKWYSEAVSTCHRPIDQEG